jgi:hypothetical protein
MREGKSSRLSSVMINLQVLPALFDKRPNKPGFPGGHFGRLRALTRETFCIIDALALYMRSWSAVLRGPAVSLVLATRQARS